MIIAAMSGQVLEFHRSAQLRVLAVTGAVRLIAAPEIPTAVEAGLPGLISENSIGLLGPAGTPRAIIEQISEATRRVMSDATYRQTLIASAFEPQVDSTPDRFRRLLEEEIARWRPIVQAIGLKLD